ncbi:hypothetical protein D3C86_1698020 [compost metagenome]
MARPAEVFAFPKLKSASPYVFEAMVPNEMDWLPLFTFRLKLPVPVLLQAASVAVISKIKVPASVGLPDKVPLAESVNPCGNAPEVTA